MVRFFASFVLLLFTIVCCDRSAVKVDSNPLLARVHSKELHLSDLEGMFPQNASDSDSSLIIQAFVNRWVRDAVLQWESERNLPSDMNIDRLVRDYRASLVRSTYEKVLVQQRMDSVVTQEQLAEYYESNKEQHQLEKPIIRCYFIKVPHPTPESKRLQRLWNNGLVSNMPALL
ncbi:MAG: hypothetical protein AAFU67_11495, partial [Bacteroidota bacterium]